MVSLKLPTNEQLCALAQAGDTEAVDALVKQNRPYIQKIVKELTANPIRAEQLVFWGISQDDLVQAGSIGLWKAISGYDPANGSEFLTYANRIIRSNMSDLIRQYSQDAIWRLRTNQANPWQIVYLDKPLDDTDEDTTETLVASPYTKSPEQICMERETVVELHKAMDVLSERENMYIRYRFGFGDDSHSLVDTAAHFHLSESRAKGIERPTLKSLKHELLFGISERVAAQAEDRLTKALVDAGELHSVELHLKSQKKRGKKVTAAVYKYRADCGGKWGELSYNFMDDTAEILLLAEWDTVVSHRAAMRAIEYIKNHCTNKLPDKIMLTFIGPEQRSFYYDDKFEASN